MLGAWERTALKIERFDGIYEWKKGVSYAWYVRSQGEVVDGYAQRTKDYML